MLWTDSMFILRFRKSASLVNCPCESVSDHVVCFRSCKAFVSSLSRSSFAFFSFHPPCFTDLLVEVRKVRESLKLQLPPKEGHDCAQKREKDMARSKHALCKGQRIFFMRRRVRGPMLKRTRRIFWPTHAFKSASNGELKTSTAHLQQEHHKSAPLLSAERDFHHAFTNPF